jgi:glycosyltransferase involved in cell wall biosynthesis
MTVSSSVKVSVIVPVYNTEVYLGECLDSLVAQTLPDIEIICVDNGSSDGSLSVLKEYASVHNNIIVLVHPEGRQGDARNAGLEVAKGEYIGFVDSDDFIHENMFLTLHKLAVEGHAEISICNNDYFFQKSGETRKNLRDEMLECDESYCIFDRPIILRNLTPWNKLLSANLIRRLALRFPLGVFYEDQYFIGRALINAKSIISTPESFYYYRKERDGSVTQDGGNSAGDVFKVMKMLEDEMGGSSELIELFHALKVSRFLELYAPLKGRVRRDFFRQQKIEFEKLPEFISRSLLTPTEFREFCFVRRNAYWSCELFYYLRRLYGAMKRGTAAP